MAIGYVPPPAEVDTSPLVAKADYDANTVLAADTDDTPVTVSLAASQVLGRKATGGIVAMTMAELREIIGSSRADDKFLRGDGTWATAGGSDTRFDAWRKLRAYREAGKYYDHQLVAGSSATTTLTSAAGVYYVPFYVSVGFSIDRIGIGVTTAASAGQTAHAGIYTSGSNGLPTTRVLESANLDIASTGAKIDTVSYTLTDDTLYFLAVRLTEDANVRGAAGPALGAPTADSSTSYAAFTQSSGLDAAPALPSTVGSLSHYTATSAPLVRVRAA